MFPVTGSLACGNLNLHPFTIDAIAFEYCCAKSLLFLLQSRTQPVKKFTQGNFNSRHRENGLEARKLLSIRLDRHYRFQRNRLPSQGEIQLAKKLRTKASPQ